MGVILYIKRQNHILKTKLKDSGDEEAWTRPLSYFVPLVSEVPL